MSKEDLPLGLPVIVIAFDSGRRFRKTNVIKTGKRGAVYVLFEAIVNCLKTRRNGN